MPKKYYPAKRLCPECRKVYVTGQGRRYCDKCSKENFNEYHREYMRKKRYEKKATLP